MKNKTRIITVLIFFCTFISVFFVRTPAYASYQSCINDSGGRGGIGAVQQACEWYSDAGLSGYSSSGYGNYCALWLGGSNSTSSVIEVSKSSGSVTVYYYGMCTVSGNADSASDVYVEGVNNSVGAKSLVARGTWGNPKSTATTLNVQKFIDGASSQSTSQGTKYTRNGTVHRCHSDGSSCATTSATISIIITQHTETEEDTDSDYEYEYETFEVKGTSSLSGVSNSKTGVKSGVYESTAINNTATFKHTLKQSNPENFSTAINFGMDGSLNRSGTLNSGSTYTYNYSDNVKTASPVLSISDAYSEPCQHISFKSKTWKITYKYRHDYKIITTNEYEGDTLVGTTTETIDLGRTLISTTLSSSGNTGRSTDACAKIHRPWNFKISSIESQNDSGAIAYAGEKVSVKSFKLNVNKNNNDYYLTDVPDATTKLIGYTVAPNNSNYEVSGSSNIGNVESYYKGRASISNYYELASPTKQIHSTAVNTTKTYNYYDSLSSYNVSTTPMSSVAVPDVVAGTKFCVALAVSPTNSDNGYVSGFSSNWTVSDSYCYTVAKKPTFQVWGGNFYSDGAVATSLNTKTVLDGYLSYKSEGNTTAYTFGSWGEYSVIANKGVSGLASGASLGYTAKNLVLDPGGNTNTSFCKLSPLSIANTNCSLAGLTGSVGNSGISGNTGVKNGIISYFVPTDTTRYASVSGTVNLSSGSNYKEDTTINDSTRYTYSSGNLSIYASDSLIRNTAHIIYAKGNVTITGDLIYDDDRYASLHQMPQYVIYAEGNINIECGVNRVDAILLAGKDLNTNGKVNTCSDVTSSYNDEKRSNQLTVNGTIIANKLTLGRTYGAGPGDASGIPAEIINVTPATFYWTTGEANSTPSLQVTFQRELSPRY